MNERIAELLAESGEGHARFDLARCPAGGNNRVFVVNVGERRLVAKCYYRNAADMRDRLWAEWSFLSFAHEVGVNCVPRPVRCNRDSNIALYEFVEGAKIETSAVGRPEIEAAADFFLALNARDAVAKAEALPPASEACFRLVDHLALVDRRLARFAHLDPRSPADADAAELVRRLTRHWRVIQVRLREEARAQGLALDANLEFSERCVSPSDFGFHNALRDAAGAIRFIDFEYAGWDDPAKMVVDFFCQPAVPVDAAHFDWFLQRISAYAMEPERLMARARLLWPVLRIKWCCIMLNEFDPDSAGRRRFARSGGNEMECRQAQIAKVRRAYETLREEG